MSCANETDCFDVTWKIENHIECLFEEGISLGTPIFNTNTADESSNTWWKLYLETRDTSSLTVKLEKMKGVSVVSKCELSLSSVFGVIKLHQEEGSANDSCYRFTIHKSVIFSEKKNLTHPQIPKDVITLNCKIWNEMIKPGKILFGSVLQKGFVFFNVTNNLDTVIYDQDHLQMTVMTYESERCRDHNSSNSSGNCRYKLVAEILPTRGGWHSFVKSKLTCTVYPNTNERNSIVAQKCRLTCSTRIWDICSRINNQILEFEFIVAVEMVGLQKPYSPVISSPLENPDLSSNPTALASDQVSASLKTLSDDLLLLYSEKFLSDVTLNTEGKSFSAHRNILSARSPVFRSMFEKDQMSESRSGIVDIDDVDSTAVDRMLVFLYGDYVGNMNWKEASALYYVADKYAIHTLKKKCADILEANLVVDNACDTLILADKHSEEQLMRCTVDFLRDHDEVLSSAKWEELEDGNPRLTTKVMRELYLKKRRY